MYETNVQGTEGVFAEGLGKRYDELWALRNVSFTVGSVRVYAGFPSAAVLRSGASTIDGTVSVCAPAFDMPIVGPRPPPP